jgi:hypothetical protein
MAAVARVLPRPPASPTRHQLKPSEEGAERGRAPIPAQITEQEKERLMAESNQYFGFLFARWRKEQADDMKKSPKDVQEAVWKQWCERLKSVTAADKESKKKRKVKDPNEPKKPLSAFMLYKDDNMAFLKSEQPDLKPTEVMQELGRHWGVLEQEEKQAYMGRATSMKQEYEAEMRRYKASLQEGTQAEANV